MKYADDSVRWRALAGDGSAPGGRRAFAGDKRAHST